MLDIILKYIFWILVSGPVILFGLYLFGLLRKQNREIEDHAKAIKAEKLAEEEQKRLFDEDYSRKHPGEF